MSIAQRKDGRYCVKFKVDDCWKQRTFRTLEEAKAFECDSKVEEAVQERLTVGALVATYIRSNDLHPQTIRTLRTSISGAERNGRHIDGYAEFLFDRYCDTLTRKDLERVRENMRVNNLRATTMNTITAQIKAALSWGFQQDLIPSHPWMGYKKLPEKKAIRVYSHDIFKAVYNAAQPWLQWAMKTAYCLCLRPGKVELFGLKWTSFDFQRGVVSITQGKSGLPKTVIPPQSYMNEAATRYEMAKLTGVEWVCPSMRGRRVYDYKSAWAKACKQAGVTMRPYDIRHLAATTMLSAGADITAVAAQLGHSDCSITGRVYAHVTPAAQKAAGLALAWE